MDLQAQYHFDITADKRIEKWQNISNQLTQMINRLKPITMQLIHITTQEQYNVVVKAMALKGWNPFRPTADIKGDRYVSNEGGFLAYFLDDAFVKNGSHEIIEFEDFIKQVA